MVSSSEEEEKKLCHKKKFKQNIYELEVRSSELKSCHIKLSKLSGKFLLDIFWCHELFYKRN